MTSTETSPSLSPSPRFWNCSVPLSRRAYVIIGVTLMLLKYGVEHAFIREYTGKFYSLLDFLNPLLTSRQHFLNGAPEWFGTTWLLWTFPFVTIAVLLSVRRAIDAGRSPWWGLAILLPGVNFLVMLALAILPSASAAFDDDSLEHRRKSLQSGPPLSAFLSMLLGVAIAAIYGFGTCLLTIYAFGSYGAALFYGTPVVAGTVAAYFYNRQESRSWPASLGVSLLPMVCIGGLFLIAALEGVICLLMAAPLVLPLAAVGGLVGKGIADSQRARRDSRRQLAGCLLVLPLIAFGESRLPNDVEYMVASSVVVDAPPEVVWKYVVDFPPIESTPPWLFRMGIASPQGARIDGSGVGATRHCDFTTGSFVEPITVWDPPRRLAFDVTDQPEPMFELTPYRHVHPPHLEGAFRSTRGEFVLEPLPYGKTRLVGHTWYALRIAPQGYWTAWTDWIIHRIHHRVLEHVRELAESHAVGRESAALAR